MDIMVFSRGYTQDYPPSYNALVRVDLDFIAMNKILSHLRQKQKADTAVNAIQSVNGRSYTVGPSARLIC